MLYLVAFLSLIPVLAEAAAPNGQDTGPTTLDGHRDMVVEVGPDEATIVAPETAYAEGYRILFLNRCQGGILIRQGFNDSRTNSSSIIDQDQNFTEYPYGDSSWNSMLNHVRRIMAPFDIEVTDVDPGNVEHTEIITCGQSFRGNNVLGVAPFACGIVKNAIGYAFAENHQDDPRAIAETVAHEAGHTFSLNHLYDCEDPMTYLNGCGEKNFVDANLSCAAVPSGTTGWEPAACSCGGSTQNAFATLVSIFGNAAPTPPELKITAPTWGENVVQEFPIRVTAEDRQNGIAEVALSIDDQPVGAVNALPYVFNAPVNLSDGMHIVTIVATDTLGASKTKEVNVCIGDDCPNAGPAPGAFGSACTGNLDCQNELCALDGDSGLCTERCDSDSSCPDNYSCLADVAICWPATQDSGGCSTGGNSAPLSAAMLLFFVGWFRTRKTRRHNP